MTLALPEPGAANPELQQKATAFWLEAAPAAGIKLDGFDPSAPLADRLTWARAHGLAIGATYSRFSTSFQHSTEDQLRTNIEAAARKRIYIPPEFVSLDEAKSGRRSRRAGFDRLKFILEHQLADTLVFFALSRLFRKQYQAARFIEEEIIERSLRAVAAVQSIDTRDEKTSRWLVSILGTADELQVEATAEHVRASHIGHFLKGYITGALTLGYRKREVPDAPRTKRGLPRYVAEVDPVLAELMRQHFMWISEGMPIAEGRRRWNAAARASGGTVPLLSPQAYRRMLSNRRLTGWWEFGRKRNKWSSKKDYVRQVLQPDSEVKQVHFEHLRIVTDELWRKVQDRLSAEPRGRHKVRSDNKPPVALWDLLTGVFRCPHCQMRFYQYGSDGELMHCASPDCTRRGAVRRKDAVLAVVGALRDLILQDHDLVQQIVAAAERQSAAGDEELPGKIAEAERAIATLSHRYKDLMDMCGVGSDQDRAETKAKMAATLHERANRQTQLAQFREMLGKSRKVITVDEVKTALGRFVELLQKAGSGELGADLQYEAAEDFRHLVNGVVEVHFDLRLGRKRPVARGVFAPVIVKAVCEDLGLAGDGDVAAEAAVEVWLRPPPRIDAMAEQARRMYEAEGLGFRKIGEVLGCGSGNACLAYKRAYEMLGLPLPPRRTNLGRPRKVG